MRVTVTETFHDRYDFSKVYRVGETADFDAARVDSLAARGLVSPIEEEEPKQRKRKYNKRKND